MRLSLFYVIMLIPLMVGINIGIGLPLSMSIGHTGFIITGLISFIALYFYYQKLIKPALRKEWVMKNGTPAVATILDVIQTGTSFKSGAQVSYLFKFTLDVHDQKGVYQATCKQFINQFHVPYYLVKHTQVDVKIDPEQPLSVVITGLKGGVAGIPGAQSSVVTGALDGANQAMVNQLEKEQQALFITGYEATARILKFWDIEGVMVQSTIADGKTGSLYGAIVEVYAPGQEVYTTEMKFFAAPEALREGRIAAGTSMIVKVDPANKFKVVFFKPVNG